MLDEEAKVVLGSGNDRGSTFRLNRFLNARAPLTKIVGKKYLRHFFRYSRCVPRPDGTVHPAAVIFSFELVFRRGLKLPNLGTPQKNVVHTSIVARVPHMARFLNYPLITAWTATPISKNTPPSVAGAYLIPLAGAGGDDRVHLGTLRQVVPGYHARAAISETQPVIVQPTAIKGTPRSKIFFSLMLTLALEAVGKNRTLQRNVVKRKMNTRFYNSYWLTLK